MRAMLEAICFQTRDVLEAMRQDADCRELRALFVDGGASQNDLLMQVSRAPHSCYGLGVAPSHPMVAKGSIALCPLWGGSVSSWTVCVVVDRSRECMHAECAAYSCVSPSCPP